MADRKAQARRMYDEVFGQGKLDVVDELTTEDMVEHEEGPPGMPEGREGVKAFVSMFRESFPDLKAEVHELIEEGDLLAARVTFSGTHKGDFMGVPASGKPISVKVFDIVRFDGDRVSEHWGLSDMLSLMQQVGAVPE